MQQVIMLECVVCTKPFAVRSYREHSAKYCSVECMSIGQKGMMRSPNTQFKKGSVGFKGKHSIKTKQHLSEVHKGLKPWNYRKKCPERSGINNHNWAGGKYRLRSSIEYKLWRDAVFQRDFYSCRICGYKGKLEAHHPLSFAKFPHLRFDINNGITLCIPCHMKVDSCRAKFKRND